MHAYCPLLVRGLTCKLLNKLSRGCVALSRRLTFQSKAWCYFIVCRGEGVGKFCMCTLHFNSKSYIIFISTENGFIRSTVKIEGPIYFAFIFLSAFTGGGYDDKWTERYFCKLCSRSWGLMHLQRELTNVSRNHLHEYIHKYSVRTHCPTVCFLLPSTSFISFEQQLSGNYL